MSSPSNLYAEKIFAEHPSVLWSLDDEVDYVSLISESQRDLATWTISNGISVDGADIKNEPFTNSKTNIITGEVPSGQIGKTRLISPNLINFQALNQKLDNFSIGLYFNSISSYISSVSLGYEYFDATSGTNVRKLKDFDTSISDRWLFLSETFGIPSENTTMRIVIEIDYLAGGISNDEYKFVVNGLTFGQWSEEFHSYSLGITKQPIPEDIAVDEEFGIEAKAYGIQEKSGYYLAEGESLLAKNIGVPMVFGSSNVTVLSPRESGPSLIVPGEGFLNKTGQFKEYTLEAWIRIFGNANESKRIIGPIGSSDGIYVDGPFISLVIGDISGSYFISEWSRPMLIHLKVIKDSVSLLINGETVISLEINTLALELPNQLNNEGKNQDWIGFYSYEDISPVEIDCVAIYSYQVPNIVAKRRWVYGQGVESPEKINTSYSGTTAFIDYPFAKYTKNYTYPDIGRWGNGTVNNLSIKNNILSVPDYSLPSIQFNDNKSIDNLYIDNRNIQNESELFFSLKPNSEWGNTESYLFFDRLNMLSEETRGFFGIIKILEATEEEQILFKLENSFNKNYLSISIVENDIQYNLSHSGVTETIYKSSGFDIGEEFAVGMHFDRFSKHFGSKVSNFLGNKNQLRVYIGGDTSMSKTFSGKIYRVGFCNRKNLTELDYGFNVKGVPFDYEDVFDLYSLGSALADAGDSYFESEISNDDPLVPPYKDALPPSQSAFWQFLLDGGTPSSFSVQRLIGKMASYTLLPKVYYNKFTFDIGISGSWEDYLPLSYFGKYVENSSGLSYYDLDFLQFNISYPAPSRFVEQETTGEWNYGELLTEYSNPVQRSYEYLDNSLYTGYSDYGDLAERSQKTYNYDTTNELVKSYLTFQYIRTGANANKQYFTEIDPAPKNGVVNVQSDWLQTKYEVVNNMIIYPPARVDFNDLAIVTHLDFNIDGIFAKPVRLQKLEMASQSFTDTGLNPIGTRFGVDLYPYTKSGFYFNYKEKNPFTIYKGSTPYLYLNKYTGIQTRGTYDPIINRGISMPINANRTADFKVTAMQLSVLYDQDFFPSTPTPIFEIQDRNDLIKFYMVAINSEGTRAKIYGINSTTGKLENGIGYYLNGKIMKEPVITVKQWAFIGLSFASLLNFSNYAGAIRMNGPIMFNNISYYQSTRAQEVQTVSKRPWFKVKNIGEVELDWVFWLDAYTWNNVLIFASYSLYGVDPAKIYEAYSGTNKIIVDDDRVFNLNSYQYSIYTNIRSQNYVTDGV
jgi:hypothetical protein